MDVVCGFFEVTPLGEGPLRRWVGGVCSPCRSRVGRADWYQALDRPAFILPRFGGREEEKFSNHAY